MSAEELHQELAKMGINLQEKDLKMYEDMWHDRSGDDLPPAALAATRPPDALSAASSSGALGRVEELKTSAASMKRRLVGSAVNSGLMVSSIMGHKVKSVMGASDKFGSALGLRRRRQGVGAGGQDSPEETLSDRRAAHECQEKENVAAAEEGGMGGQVTSGGIGGAKQAVMGTLKAGASTLGWGVSKAKVLIRTGSGGSGGAECWEAPDIHATGGHETGAPETSRHARTQGAAAHGPRAQDAAGGGGSGGGGAGAPSRVTDAREGIPAAEVQAGVSPRAQDRERRVAEAAGAHQAAEAAARSNSEADAAAGEAARPEGMTRKFRRMAAGGSRRMLGLVRGDEAGAAACSGTGAGARETVPHGLPGLARESLGVSKGDNLAAGKGAASRIAARSERGDYKALSEEATRSCEHGGRPVGGEGVGGAIFERVRSAGGRVGGSNPEQATRWQALRSRTTAMLLVALQPLIRALDRKLVIIDLVTIHRVHVHVDWVVRVLQGNLPPGARETVRLQDDARSEGSDGQKLALTSDKDAGAGQGPAGRLVDGERGGEVDTGDQRKIAAEGDVEGTCGNTICGNRENAGHRDDKPVPPLFLEAIRMTADDFRPDPTLLPPPLGIPPSEAVSFRSLRCPGPVL